MVTSDRQVLAAEDNKKQSYLNLCGLLGGLRWAQGLSEGGSQAGSQRRLI